MQQVYAYHEATREDKAASRQVAKMLWAKFKTEYETAQNKDFYVPLCTYSYAATTLKANGTQPSSVVYESIDDSDTVTPLVQDLCSERLERYRTFMGGTSYDGWGMEIEVNYYPFRGNHGLFGLHKDDYFRDGVHHTDEGGVMFVCLVYLVEYPVFGPEVTLDRGNGFDFAELTLPQIASLPPSFCRRIVASKTALIDQMTTSQYVHCPIIAAWSEIMFCDTLAIHQTPATLQQHAPPDLKFTSHNPVAGEVTGEERTHFTNLGLRFPFNRKTAKQVQLPLERQLSHFYSLKGTNLQVGATFHNTNTRQRSFLRLTFRAQRPSG